MRLFIVLHGHPLDIERPTAEECLSLARRWAHGFPAGTLLFYHHA